MKTILVVVGTRPDAIKLLPLYQALKKELCNVLLCATFQHDELLQQVFDLFNVVPDVRLDVMKKDQDLAYLTATILEKMRNILREKKPDLVLVQGDTATAFASSLAAYYQKISIGHVEAGLRTGNVQAPFPEEAYRCFISMVADYHFAPTSLNVANLLAEKIKRETIFHTGNTVVDALLVIKKNIEDNVIAIDLFVQNVVAQARQQHKKLILLTAHRRESFDGGLVRIFSSIKKFALEHSDVLFYFPVHPNSNVHKAIQETLLHEVSNIIFAPPVSYQDLVYLLINAHWVVTDSGGIQEEAMSLGKKVIILRDATERIEGVWEGFGVLAGTNEASVFNALCDFYALAGIADISLNAIYGDGNACKKIITVIKRDFLGKPAVKDFLNQSKSQLQVT